MNYGKTFKTIRDEKMASRSIVAKGLGCTQSALSKIENGRVIPKQATIERLCKLYGIPLARFYCLAFESEDFTIPVE